MAKKGTYGMVSPLGEVFDGTKGHSSAQGLQESFPSSPIFKNDITHPTDAEEWQEGTFHVNDEGITGFYLNILDGPITVNPDFQSNNPAIAGVSMDYNDNIKGDENAPHADLDGMTVPYKVPNPSNADLATPHEPTSKATAPDGFQDDQEIVSFGSGEGSTLSIEDSSINIAQTDFTTLTPGRSG